NTQALPTLMGTGPVSASRLKGDLKTHKANHGLPNNLKPSQNYMPGRQRKTTCHLNLPRLPSPARLLTGYLLIGSALTPGGRLAACTIQRLTRRSAQVTQKS